MSVHNMWYPEEFFVSHRIEKCVWTLILPAEYKEIYNVEVLEEALIKKIIETDSHDIVCVVKSWRPKKCITCKQILNLLFYVNDAFNLNGAWT